MTISASPANAGKPYTQAEFEARRADNAKLVDYLRNSGLEIPANKVARLIATAAQAFGGTTQPATRRDEVTDERRLQQMERDIEVMIRSVVGGHGLGDWKDRAIDELLEKIAEYGCASRTDGCTCCATPTLLSHEVTQSTDADGLMREMIAQTRLGHRQFCVGVHPETEDYPAQAEWEDWSETFARLANRLRAPEITDTERLDWLSAEGDTWIVPSVNGFVVRRVAEHDDDATEFPTLREAIDAARGISTTPKSTPTGLRAGDSDG